ncbi:MAG: ornithine carbamoyltransferase [Candidatus Atribacteria bacterium]|nr:ornithine carbamoyltransferase [Candidatus Atribacteria bacterium]
MREVFRGRDFLSISDFSALELTYLLDSAVELKRRWLIGEPMSILTGKTMALLFEKPSLRTRVSFQLAMSQLGGNALYLSPQEVGLGKREAVKDVARVLSRMVDGILLRTFDHYTLLELAKYSSVPVVNGLSDLYHPCQVLGDLLTIKEKKRNLTDQKICFVGDGNNVCHSLVEAAAVLGLNLVVSSPLQYRPQPEIWDRGLKKSQATGGTIVYLENPEEAVQEADVLYTDVWTSMGKEEERETRKARFARYQLNEHLLSMAKDDCIVMHCMPANRGEEIVDSVMDGPNSVVIDQAENRLHAQKALLALILS